MEQRKNPRRLRLVQRVVVAAAVVVTVASGAKPLLAVVVLFVVVGPFEWLFPRHRQRLLRPQFGTDLAYALLAGPLKAMGTVVGVPLAAVSLMWLPGLALRPLVSLMPAPARVALGFVLFDALAYWAHRWMHRVPLLWRFHAIHHSSRRLDWLAGFRTHPLDGTLLAPAFIVLVAAGFSIRLTGILLVAQLLVAFFAHANVRWRLRPLQRIMITPEFHHWHHSDERQAMDSNFASFLPVWDVVFGTWFMPTDRRPSGYGIGQAVPDGFVAQLLHPLPDRRAVLQALRHPVLSVKRAGPGVRLVLRQIRDASRPSPALDSA